MRERERVAERVFVATSGLVLVLEADALARGDADAACVGGLICVLDAAPLVPAMVAVGEPHGVPLGVLVCVLTAEPGLPLGGETLVLGVAAALLELVCALEAVPEMEPRGEPLCALDAARVGVCVELGVAALCVLDAAPETLGALVIGVALGETGAVGGGERELLSVGEGGACPALGVAEGALVCVGGGAAAQSVSGCASLRLQSTPSRSS